MDKVGVVNYCIRCPIGVAGLISPWNLPLYLLSFKIAPAIAAGNTVVCKPSEMTSVTAWMMAKLMNEAGKRFVSLAQKMFLLRSTHIKMIIFKFVCYECRKKKFFYKYSHH